MNESGRPTVSLFNPISLAPAVGYAHAAKAGGIVWLAGQISSDSSGTLLFPGDLVAQFGQAIWNVRLALASAGCRPQDVVKITYFVTDVAAYRHELKPIGQAYREVFGHHYPATTLLEVKGLFEPDAMIEIECVAIPSEA